jgi:hypothetical protein
MDNIPGDFPGMPGPGNTALARQKVSTPAILLMVTGALVIVYWLYVMVTVLTGKAALQLSQLPPELANDPNLARYREFLEGAQGPAGALFCLFFIAAGGLIILGGLKMKNLQSYALAMTAAILAMIPCCSCYCCLVGLPAGIWALVVLFEPEVKAAFRRG